MQVGCRQVALSLFGLMRIIPFILSIYVLALSIIPCSDSITCSDDDYNVELSQTEHSINHSDHHDFCTPFCTCACCGTLVSAPSTDLIDEVKTSASGTYIFPYRFNYFFEYTEGIWHPPAKC